jgi:hypothetical protein
VLVDTLFGLSAGRRVDVHAVWMAVRRPASLYRGDGPQVVVLQVTDQPYWVGSLSPGWLNRVEHPALLPTGAEAFVGWAWFN